MDDVKKNKIIKFINDKTMSDAVYDMLLNTFLTSKMPRDVYILASERLSIDRLRDAWKEIERYKETDEEKIKNPNNVGL